jgi:NAD(P)-dependent dehydrogenase (short-subunit alcohol dehydrogenase family)
MNNKTAIITGGGRGIGLEIAVAYAEAGAVVYCLDLAEKPNADWEKCRAWIDALPRIAASERNGRLEYAQCDVTQQKPLWDLVQRIADKENGVHICVASAGIGDRGKDVLEYEEDAFEQIMKVNTSGVLFTAQAAGRQMVAHGIKGSIILIASMAGSIALRVYGFPMCTSS